MTQLSDGQIAGYVLGAGFTGNSAVTAVAVVLAESGGDTGSVGDVKLQTGTWGPSIGLFQIRSLNAQKGSGGQRDALANVDPATNAKNAYAISSSGRTFAPWSTYKSGSYLKFLNRAQAAIKSPGSVSAASVGGSSNATTTNPVASGISALIDPGTWRRLGAFLLGGLFLIFALYRATDVQRYIKGALKTATKVGAVVG
jgi:hypothetical protein